MPKAFASNIKKTFGVKHRIRRKMQIQNFSFGAWTPEIGGIFTDLKLKLKPWLRAEAKVLLLSLARKYKLAKADMTDDRISTDYNNRLIDCIVDWENFYDENGEKVPCTPENVKKFIAPFWDQTTGFEVDQTENPLATPEYISMANKVIRQYDALEAVPGKNIFLPMIEYFQNVIKAYDEKPKYYLLSGYVEKFVMSGENYTKNLRSTAISGKPGGVPGNGSNPISLNL